MKEVISTLNLLHKEGYFEDYAIGGGIATLFYTEPFATIDVDVFIHLKQESSLLDLSPIFKRLKELGHKADGQYVRIGDTPVQFLVAPSDLEEEALRESIVQTYESLELKVFRAEYLAAIYLSVHRPKDRVRVQMLMEQAEPDMALFESIIERHNLRDQWKEHRKENS